MSEQRPNKTLDCTGMLCPMPVVKTNKTIRGMAVGEILEMTATDPGSMPDMQAWARQTQHELLLAEEAKEGLFRFVIRKTH
jgi:tRNA 2-thiouridine synthesizing protein A